MVIVRFLVSDTAQWACFGLGFAYKKQPVEIAARIAYRARAPQGAGFGFSGGLYSFGQHSLFKRLDLAPTPKVAFSNFNWRRKPQLGIARPPPQSHWGEVELTTDSGIGDKFVAGLCVRHVSPFSGMG
jgi:hypothetical protein